MRNLVRSIGTGLGLALLAACGAADRTPTATGALPVTVVVSNPWSAVLVGARYPFYAMIRNSAGSNVTPTVLRWASSDSTVLAIDAVTGLGTPRRPGVTALTATADGIASAPLSVTVLAAPTVQINAPAVLNLSPGQTLAPFTVLLLGVFVNVPITDREWRTSDSTVARVSSTGVVTTVGQGVAVISVRVNGAWTGAVPLTVHRRGSVLLQTRVIGPSSAWLDSALAIAVLRWQDVLVGPVDPVPLVAPAGRCGYAWMPALDGGTAQTLLILVHVDTTPLARNAYAYGGTCLRRAGNNLPTLSLVVVDSTFHALNRAAGSEAMFFFMEKILEHEIGHALGFGQWTLPNAAPYVDRSVATDWRWTGPKTLAQAVAAGVPAAVLGPTRALPITDSGHWRATQIYDLMMGQDLAAPRSTLTVGVLEDMGYQVDYRFAEPYAGFPASLALTPGAAARRSQTARASGIGPAGWSPTP